MQGLMQDVPLTLQLVLRRAERLFGNKVVATKPPSGGSGRPTRSGGARAATGERARDFGVGPRAGRDVRLEHRAHLELYFAAPCMGAVLHTLNLRLFPDQLAYIANHAEDKVVFVDRSLLPMFLAHGQQVRTIRQVVVIDDGAGTRCPRARSTTRSCWRPPTRSTAGSTSTTRTRRGDVLHVGHHRQPQGRGLQPPLDGAALADQLTADGARAARARHRPAGRADVPRQRLGPALRGAAGRAAWCSPGRT